ncbi:MAG: hypothetical protein KatS3mg115_0731 [Candidatus Poribacteria bacterium]|nr:MAG: hypothetical protein KatS3mg115_0731 [Candidatus Poribacteria bacterium]
MQEQTWPRWKTIGAIGVLGLLIALGGCSDDAVGSTPDESETVALAPALGFLPSQNAPVSGVNFGSLTQTVTLTETGAVVEITSEDPEVAAQLQSMAELMGARLGDSIGARRGHRNRSETLQGRIETTVTPIEGGIRIEHVGRDEEAVQAIQRHARTLGTPRWTPRPQHVVQREVEELEDGVLIRLTSSDAAAVERLHDRAESFADRGPNDPEVTAEVVAVDQGIEVRLRGTTPEAVERLKRRFLNETRPELHHQRTRRPEGPPLRERVRNASA